MAYRIKRIEAGNIIEVKRYHCFRCPEPKTPRRAREKPTSEAMKKVNTANAVDKLYYKLCANFTENDLYITLKYDGCVNKSIACEQMKADVQKFQDLMRAEYKKSGRKFRFVLAYGISENRTRHAHMVVNAIEQKTIQRCWKRATDHAGRVTFEYLWSGYDYRGLAEYLIKNGMQAIEYAPQVFSKKYSCSRNLAEPIVTVETVTRSKTFCSKPKAEEGCELLEVRTGKDLYGFRYVKYTMRKLE